MRLGYSVNGYGVGDLAACVDEVTDARGRCARRRVRGAVYGRAALRAEWRAAATSLRDAARIEIGHAPLSRTTAASRASPTTFEDLHGLAQLPGSAPQRLMADGYGFAAEGDWKTAALVRSMKVMAAGLDGGTSFMEDYTYHLHPDGQTRAGRAHARDLSVHRRGQAVARSSSAGHRRQGGSGAAGVRLAAPGPAVNASVVDMGDRFRMIVNEVDVVAPEEPLPKLPVARALWDPRPNLRRPPRPGSMPAARITRLELST